MALDYKATLESIVAAAYVHDRAEQYENSSGIRCAMEELSMAIAKGEHIDAFNHGELDDMLTRPWLRNELKKIKRARDGQ